MRPNVQFVALSPLVGLMSDKDAEVQTAAIYGVLRSISRTAEARKAIGSLIRHGSVQQQRRILSLMGYQRTQDTELIGHLQGLLSSPEQALVKDVIQTLGVLGSAAKSLKPDLQRIIDTEKDPELIDLARSAISRIDGIDSEMIR